MSYLVLARKWRPQTFTEVVGQEHVTRTLRNALSSGRVAHAFLFTGPRGVGKTTTARLLAKALNCADGPTPDPCNVCSNCLEITAGSALDVLEIDGASHTGVDHIRDLTEGVQYRPAKSRFRVVIIDEVHMLSNAAFNALLKTLEEPPAHVKFIFATTEAHKVLQTILSRCQRYDFKRIPLRELMQRLRLLAEREGLTVDEAGLALIAREADGSLRDAESLIDQVVAWSGGTVNEQVVREALGVADRQALFRVVETVLARDPAQALRLAAELSQYGYDPRRLCRDLLEHFRHLVIAKISEDPTLLADLPDHEVAAVRQQAATRSLEDLQRLFSLMLRAEEEVGKTAYTQLIIDMTLVKLASQPAVMPIDDALAQLEALSRKLAGGNAQEPPPSGTRIFQPKPPAPQPTPLTRKEETQGPRSTALPVVEEATPAIRPLESPDTDAEQHSAWEGFLAAVQKEKISLFFALRTGRMLDLTPTTLQIVVDKDPYLKDLTRKESRTILQEIARRFFGRDLTVEVTKGSSRPSSTPSSPLSSPSPTAPQSQAPQAESDPLVKTVLDILGGEVQTTPRSYRSPG
jgi:DNA polymerase III subunit gamma/tau